MQRRQSGLKSVGSWIRVKNSIYPGKFSKHFDFSPNFTKNLGFRGKFPKNVDFFQANFRKVSIFSGNFTKKIGFPVKNWPFTATSGKISLFYFSSKVEHTSCTGYNINISRPVHDPLPPPRPRGPKSGEVSTPTTPQD